jgi:hypothetical protein
MTLGDLGQFANSSFTTSLVGAIAGAFAGAYVAQRVAERVKLRDELTREIRHVNSALGLAFGIANSAMAMKRQHVLPLKQAYEDEVGRHEAWKASVPSPAAHQSPVYSLGIEFNTFSTVYAPIAALQDFVYTRINVIGRPINLVITLTETLQTLATAIDHRGKLVSDFKSNNMPPGASVAAMFFGLPYGQGNVNQEYPGTIHAISLYTDCVIWFSVELADDLRSHGLAIASRYEKSFGRPAPRVSRVDFTAARTSGLIPRDHEFKDWQSGFKVEEPPSAWWQRDA